ncbi:hypothetical protein BG004_006989 [Podila humilis]|nr:hypothetical protein BG004_006989 [Podila humilis]
MMADLHSEEIVATSEPQVEIIEEIREDGTKVMKKKTTRTITKRVLSSSSSSTEPEISGVTTSTSTSTISSTSSSSGSNNNTSSSSSSSGTHGTATVIVSEASSSSSSSSTSEPKEIKGESKGESKAVETEESSSKKTFKYKIFGEGDSQSHPFYRFLARFPLKSLPAQHHRPRPVKPTIYAYAPGWKLNRPTKETTEAPESVEDKDDHASEKKAEDDSSQLVTGSFDADSLKWMAYLKFNNIDYDIRPAFEPNMSPSGKLPFLALPDGSFVTADGFEEFVQKNGTPLVKLDLDEVAEAYAFITLAESKIHTALLYTVWLEETHFMGATRSHYYGHHVPLLAWILSYQERSNTVNSMLATRPQIDRELIFEEAATAVEALAVLLGKNEYFFGKSAPSSLDAVVFAYLHVILTLPRVRNADDAGRSSELSRIVRKHTNLFEYSQRIWRKFFVSA